MSNNAKIVGIAIGVVLCCVCGLALLLGSYTLYVFMHILPYINNTGTRPELAFTPENLPNGQMRIEYKAKITISKNVTPVIDFYLNDANGTLPPGLAIERVQGEDAALISGTSVKAGSYTFTISVKKYAPIFRERIFYA